MRSSVTAALAALSVLAATPSMAADYRGHTIRLNDSPQAAQCAAMVRKGIDLLDTLSPRLRALGHEVKDLRCEPTPPNATNTRAQDSVVGVYTVDGPNDPGGRIIFRRNPDASAANLVALSLVGNGVYARRQREYNEGKRHPSSSPAVRARMDWLEKVVTKSDINLVLRAECENMDATYEALKALDPDPRQLSALNRVMRERNCPL